MGPSVSVSPEKRTVWSGARVWWAKPVISFWVQGDSFVSPWERRPFGVRIHSDSLSSSPGPAMPPSAPQFPAVMILREQGEILFLDRRATALTGYGPEEVPHLDALLAGVFPEEVDQVRATRLFRHAAATAGRRGSARFHAEFPAKNGRRRRTTIQVQRWGGNPGQRSYLVSFLPSDDAPGADQAVVIQAVARRVARLLKEAATFSQALSQEADGSDERFAVLSALIERAQGLLGSLEVQVQGDPLANPEDRA